ncbi:tRNA uridine-5-carboxymethylaminomethyl(34) synthesis GTPase MnmE [Xanthobacter pseudotagetidis]|uniref:tRNA uridine-5-carboxymethylaminomethyl(34) synthesis GTPase MnmE n=1 Tax=Xanthobacter pseudotagetidis TaxID=3119911 RepID=UPI003728C26D
MTMFADTIFALSSGRPPSGVAVVRLSGPGAGAAVRALSGVLPTPRAARYGALRDPATGEVLDRGLALFFPGPASATGEDVGELHLHGGRAVVAAVLRTLGALPGLRPAGAGEFTRRAFANGKMDLSEVEGLADLVAAETEAQRRQALALASGALSRRIADWRAGLVKALALVEASIDFSDEGDVPDDLVAEARAVIVPLAAAVEVAVRDAGRGERVRDGITVAIAGPPNAGKSTLLNLIAGRDAAIVSPIPGTTRDVLEVHLELAGQAVLLLDTAGLRESADAVEQEGVRRALARAEAADLVLWLSDGAETPPAALARAIRVRTKADLGGPPVPPGWIGLSAHSGAGIEALLARLEAEAQALVGGEPALVSRARQRLALAEASGHLARAAGDFGGREELRAEELRLAARALDRVIGRVDVEDVLDALFGAFCIGK